jgi:TetR/AcrR family transcriptional repressor of mexJK operon
MTRTERRAKTPHRKGRKRRRAAAPRRAGRPSREQAQRLGERILDVATALFLARGYGATSIEAVAQRAGISKRTFYHRFADKPTLFGAVLHRIVDRLRPPASMPLVEGVDLREVLERLAGLILRAALTPQAVALHRLIVGESGRFPKLAAVVAAESGTAEAIRLIAGVLEREAHAGKLALDDPAFAAEQFLYMVMATPQRRAAGLGVPLTRAEIDAWPRKVVNLFLNGCRGWARDARRTPHR